MEWCSKEKQIGKGRLGVVAFPGNGINNHYRALISTSPVVINNISILADYRET